MHIDDQPYLGIMTPFGGLRVLARSGQGLIGQSEELDELMAKIFHQEMKEGTITKIQDDIIIGGDTQTQAANNYIRVLHKLPCQPLCRATESNHLPRIRRYSRLDMEERWHPVCVSTQEELANEHEGT